MSTNMTISGHTSHLDWQMNLTAKSSPVPGMKKVIHRYCTCMSADNQSNMHTFEGQFPSYKSIIWARCFLLCLINYHLTQLSHDATSRRCHFWSAQAVLSTSLSNHSSIFSLFPSKESYYKVVFFYCLLTGPMRQTRHTERCIKNEREKV